MITPSLLGSRLLAGVSMLTLLASLALFASRPAHTAGGPIPVSVANTPLATRSEDSEVRQPFQTEIPFFQGTTSGFSDFGSFTVPAGKELVIQSVAGLAYAPNSTKAFLKITTTAGGTQVTHYAGILSPGLSANYFTLPLTRYSFMRTRTAQSV